MAIRIVIPLALFVANWFLLGANVILLLRTRENLRMVQAFLMEKPKLPPLGGMADDGWDGNHFT